MATLSLADGYRTRVWRVVKEAFLADPTYDAAGVHVVMADNGDRDTSRSLDSFAAPCVVRLWPSMGSAGQFFTEAEIKATLLINVEVCLKPGDLEDLMNLQEALEDTLNPLETKLQQLFNEAGAIEQFVTFATPIKETRTAPKQEGITFASGQFSIAVRRPFVD